MLEFIQFMFLRRPSDSKIAAFKKRQSKNSPNFTIEQQQRKIEVQHHRVKLGQGEELFAFARELIKEWQVFCTPDCTAYPPDEPPKVGLTTVSLLREWGIWFLISCRITEVLDSNEEYGFTYETLPGHVECGYETFKVKMDPVTKDVDYIIDSKSNHRFFLFWLASPIVHWLQMRYKINSAKHMQKMCLNR